MAPSDPTLAYRQRLAAYTQRSAHYARRSLALSRARLAIALVLAAALVAVVATSGGEPRPWAMIAGAAAAMFAVLVVVHERVIRAENRWRGLAELQEEGLARSGRDWERLPVPVAAPPAREADLARDLQLFGRASLLQLLGTAQSPPGRTTLVRWLLAPALPVEVARRQRAVAALAPALDLRQLVALEGRRLAAMDPDVEPFLAWAEGEPWLLQRRHWLWTSRLLPLAAWGASALAIGGLLPGAFPAALFAATFLLANLLVAPLEAAHDRVAAREREMSSYAAALATLETSVAEEVEPGELARLRQGVGPAASQLHELQRRLDLADARRSGLLRLVLGTLFLWDVHTLWLLERWQVTSGRQARHWLDSLGELEALGALAGLAFDEPRWALPEVDPGADRLRAHELAHPLLPAGQRVANDVAVGPAGKVLLVTGSNMSGKSTLLRALGVNVILAQAGGPVCARSMSLPPTRLATSILVEDSLEQGISFFMAEVLRIRTVVAAAEEEAEAGEKGRRVLYLLDEILRGTNSADRRVAVQGVLDRLLALGAIGAVSTHDLALAEEPGLREHLVPVHFRETLHPEAGPQEPMMSFDYHLRPGVAPTTNALALMQMVGLR